MVKGWSDLQLSFDLDLDEVADDASERAIAPDQARVISEAARAAFEGSAAEGGWIQEYVSLREKGWPWRVAAYIAWSSSPKSRRRPGTVAELATDVLGLRGPRVIYSWRKKYPTIDAVVAMLQAAPLWEHRRDVINALVESAIQPDYKSFNDRKLFLEMTGDYVPRSQLKIQSGGAAKDLSELTDEELDRLVGEPGATAGETEEASAEDGDDDA